MKKKLVYFISFLMGTISGLLGFIGALGFCSAPWIIALFALLGFNSMLLMTYNKWFLLVGFFFFGLAGLIYFNRKKSTCSAQEKPTSKLNWFQIVILGWLIFIGGVVGYSSWIRPESQVKQISPSSIPDVEAYLKFKQIKASALPSGIPDIYGKELNISFEEAQKAIDTVSPFDPTYGTQDKKIVLSGGDFERYKKIGSQVACEYCCGVETLVFENGEAACGCAHSQMMRGLAAYLIENHPELTDEQILVELKKWKAVFFPKETLTAKIAAMEKAGEPGIKELLQEFPDFLPQMVGGC